MSSILQRIARSVNWNATRQFTTSNTVRNAVESTPKPQGLYQFFENNETLPKQIWTGKLLERERDKKFIYFINQFCFYSRSRMESTRTSPEII
jgi:hypothetical protein